MVATSNHPAAVRDQMTDSFDEYCAQEVRSHDPDRWLTALFAPASKQPGLLALYAFNSEIARARESVSQPMIGQIRLQWWREAWDGIMLDRPRKHPIVQALHTHLRHLDVADIYALIEARERDMDPAPMADLPALLAYAEATSAPLMRLAVTALGGQLTADLREAIRLAGTAYALTGILRATPYLVMQQRVLLPADLLWQAGIAPDALHQKDHGQAVAGVIAAVATVAEERLNALGGRRIGRDVLPALLPASLARVHLQRLIRVRFDPESPAAIATPTRKHLGLIGAWLRRRV